jgi:hypothetical protein
MCACMSVCSCVCICVGGCVCGCVRVSSCVLTASYKVPSSASGTEIPRITQRETRDRIFDK